MRSRKSQAAQSAARAFWSSQNDKMKEFRLEHTDFIELHNLLKVLGLCDTGGMAKAAVAEGHVKVNDVVELRKRCKLRRGDRVVFEDHKVVVV